MSEPFPSDFDFGKLGDVTKFPSLTAEQKVSMVQMALLLFDRRPPLTRERASALRDEEVEGLLQGTERSIVALRWDLSRGSRAYDPVKVPQAIAAFEREHMLLLAEQSSRAERKDRAEARRQADRSRHLAIIALIVSCLSALFGLLRLLRD